MSLIDATASEPGLEKSRTARPPGASKIAPAPSATEILPARSWQLINARELWQFRELLFFLAWRDVKVRYKQTALGAAWAVLQPALMMVVFTLFFGRMANVPTGGLPYPLFAYAGLLPWTFFATAISSAANSVVGSERLVTKIYFPRLAIPFASVGAAVIDFFIALGLLIILMLYYGFLPGAGLLTVPLLLAMLGLAALGVGTLLSALTVYYRDFRYVVPYLVQLWMFATPSVYMKTRTDGRDWVSYLLTLNPVNAIIDAFRSAMLGGEIPWRPLASASVLIAIAFLAACMYFRRVEDQFADFI